MSYRIYIYIPYTHALSCSYIPLFLLQGLTQVEEMLISAVLPIMTLYRLPHGQYGYSGHVINLPQNIVSFANTLPRLPSELDVIIVRKEGAVQTHHDFRVRRSVVLRALQWLTANNIYYRTIAIDCNALAMLPEDGDLAGMCTVTLGPSGADSDEEASATQDTDPYNAHLPTTFIPIAGQRMTEQEAVRQTVHEQHSATTPPTVPWPSLDGTPVNEFKTEGYISCAFPTLFPTGRADFVAPRINAVTVGNYFKHLMMYKDGRFARHPRFRYFALNTEMRWRALQTGRIYVRQHPDDAQLSAEELREMVGQEGEAFSSRVLHYASTLRGTRQYWMKQRSRLIAMVDTLGLPTIFFTHSAADLQWPELARLICPQDPESSSSRSKAVTDNPAVADWFFHHRIQKFMDAFYIRLLGATDYWMRFEWQHRGSPHVHGLAWFPDAPDVEQLLRLQGDAAHVAQDEITQFVDRLLTTINPAVLPDGSNAESAPPPQTHPHICNQAYTEVTDFNQDLAALVATCQRHTRCSAAYCLRTRGGKHVCRFGYPKPLQLQTSVVREDGAEPVLITARNDALLNSYNPMQLSAWRANVDMQYCMSRQKVITYCAKYATKCEPRSLPLKEIFSTIVRTLTDDNPSLKAVQKLLVSSVGERDYSAQETCHLLLQLPLFRASRDFVNLSLDGSRAVESHLQDNQPATALSILDHYCARPEVPPFQDMPLLYFSQHYTLPRQPGAHPPLRGKKVVVIVRPYCSPDPTGPKYEQYCQQKLMLHNPFRHVRELRDGFDTFAEAYAHFLQSSNIPQSLEDDIRRLEQQQSQQPDEDAEDSTEVRLCMHAYMDALYAHMLFEHACLSHSI